MLERLFRRQVYYIVSIVFVILGIVYFIACLYQPFVGINIENTNGQWLVISSDPNGYGYKSGIQVGDQILKINNEDPGKYRFVQKWGAAEGASTIEFLRPEQISGDIITIQKASVLHTVISDFPMYILGFIFWFSGFITWFKRPFLVQARALFWLNWLIALAFVMAHASSRGLLFAGELECITLSLVPVFLISFVTIFPITNKNRINKTGWRITILLSLIIFSLIVLQSLGIVYLMGMLRKLVLADMIIGIIFVLWNLGLSVRLSKDKPERNQASIILLGMAVGFLPIILFTAVPIIFNYQQLVYAQVSTLSISIIPISLYYVIVNKYLPDSRRLFIKIISFILIALIISFAVVVTHFLLQVIQTINLEIYLASLFLTILLIAGTYFGYQAISGLLEKYYFQDKNGYRQRIKELKEKINSLFAEDEMIDDLIKSLGIEGVFIIIENPQIGCLRKAGGRFREKQNVQTELEDFFHNDQRLGMEARMLPDDFPAAIYIPFVSHDSACGIFFGHRTSRIKFVQSDLAFLTLLAGQLAHRLIMAFIIRKLNKESKFVTNINRKLTKENLLLSKKFQNSHQRILELQSITNTLVKNLEQERKLIVKEIYNGPLHSGLDLCRWTKYLKEESLPNNKKQEVINHIQDLVEDVNHELHLIADELHPPTLADLGLLTAIELLCQEIMLKEQSLISLKTSGISSEDRFKEEVEITAYRFLQEGIMNSIRHSGTNKQRVYIELNESGLELKVSDLGRGFDVSQMEEWLLKGTHVGIAEMKERIESLSGKLEINSVIHKGTTIKATIPVLSLG